MAKPERTTRVRQAAHAITIEEPSAPAVAVIPPVNGRERLSLPVDASGALDWETLRASTREKLKTAFADTARVQRELGIGGAVNVTAPPSAEIVKLNAMLVQSLYKAVGGLLVLSARSRGVPDDAAELLRFHEDECAMLVDPTLAVLNKYELLGGKYAEEITLIACVGSMLGGHVMAMNARITELQKAA